MFIASSGWLGLSDDSTLNNVCSGILQMTISKSLWVKLFLSYSSFFKMCGSTIILVFASARVNIVATIILSGTASIHLECTSITSLNFSFYIVSMNFCI